MLGHTTKDENAPGKLGSPKSQTCLGTFRIGVKL